MSCCDGRTSLPLVSIVTPSLNQVQFVADTIESVLGQDYPRIEHIVIDGGSSDGTVEVLRGYGSRVKWISEIDRGQAHAINKGFERATGEILAYIDADNVYLPQAVRTAVEFLVSNPNVTLVHGDCQIISADGRTRSLRRSSDFGLERLLGVNTICAPTVFFRRQVLELVGTLNEALSYTFDWEYWIRVASNGLEMAHLPVIMARFREHAYSKTMTRKELFWRERREVLDEIFSSEETPDEIQCFRDSAYSGIALSKAFHYLRRREWRRSGEALLETVRLWPGMLLQYSPGFLSQALRDLTLEGLRRNHETEYVD